jgi:hypothetical protein
MRPLRIKASGSPPSSANFQGLQEMTDAEIQQYVSYVITNKFATDWDGTGTAELNMDTANALSGSAIGTFTDTTRNDAIGTHPTAGATTDTTYYFKQVTSTAAESITNRAVGWDTGAINEFTDAELDTDILDKVIDDMVSESDYTVGQFHLAASSPAGGTWTSRYTITDTVLSGNNTTYLWQKTSPTSAANSDYASLKYDSGLKMMTAAEIEQMVPNFRNRIVEGYGTTPGVGCYLVQSSSPTETGTWTQMGDVAGFSDTRQEVASSTYEGAYTGAFSGEFTNDFTGEFTGAKTYTGAYTGTFSGDYAGNYVGTSTYSGAYTGDFSGAYILYYSGYVGAYYTGTYQQNFTGFFSGAKTYTGTYTGAFDQAFSGDYVGTSNYSGTYTGSFTGYFSADFTGGYAGDTVKATTETVSTIKLWLRTA